MNRLVIASSVVLGTFVLGIFAVAIAQRDARHRATNLTTLRPDYSQQLPQPLSVAEAQYYGDATEVYQAKPALDPPPLDVPPPLSSRTIVRANDASVSQEVTSSLASNAWDQQPPIQEDEPQRMDEPQPFRAPPGAVASLSRANLQEVPEASVSLASPYPENPLRQAATQQPPVPTPTLNNPQPLGSPSTLAPPPLAPGMPATMTPPGSSLQNQGAPSTSSMMPPPVLPQSGSSPLNDPPSIAPPVNRNRTMSPPSNLANPDPVANRGTMPNTSTLPMPGMSSPNASPMSQPMSQPMPQPLASTPAVPQDLRNAPPVNRELGRSIEPSTQQLAPSSSQPMTRDGYTGRDANPNQRSDQWGSTTNLVNETPGQRLLDGAQNPSLQLQKKAPEEVQVGQSAIFTLVVRNVGNATAHDVTVLDRVPRGTRLNRTSPPTEEEANGSLVWKLGEMPAGAEQTITVELIPETEGEIGSVASVTFASQASVRSISTQPRLEVTQHSEKKVLIGESVNIRMQVTNVGTGVAKDVWLEEEVPTGMRHPQGGKLELSLGDLAPGESRSIPLELIAADAGVAQNVVRAVAANVPAIDSVGDVEVIAPQLKLAMTSPRMRYLERQFTYQVSITNTGTAVARNVEMVGYLPKGLRFNSAGNQGEYLADQHAAAWGLEELAPGETATTELTVLPVEEGEFVFRMQAMADGVRAEPAEKPIRIEGQSELSFAIDDDNDPIETDGETTYSIAISNIGTRADANVELALALPPGAQVIQVQAPVRYQARGDGLIFEPIPEMRSKDRQTFRVVVRLAQEGTQVARAMVKSQLRPLGETKEESTQVYLDR